jgi:tetratricopeptide (TPR) repeat protein
MRLLVWRVGTFGFPFGALLPLAAWGVFINRKRLRELWWLWALNLCLLISLIGYWNSSRYRLSTLPVLVLFAAAALVDLTYRIRGDRMHLPRAALTLLLVGLVASLPLGHFLQTYDFEAESYGLAGLSSADEGRVDQGLELAIKAIEMKPESYYLHFLLARILLRADRVDEAVAQFSKAAELNPSFYLAYSEMGLALANRRQFDDALSSYLKSLEINPRLCVSHYYVGEIMAARGRYDDAINSFTTAVSINPEMYLAFNELGFAWARKGDLDRAIDFFRKAVAINPKYDVARDNLNGALARRNGKL